VAIKMAKLSRDPASGVWRARKVIPVDCRVAFGKREEKPTWPATLSESEARHRFGAWLLSGEGRIAEIRTKGRGALRSQLSPADVEHVAALWRAHLLQEDDEHRAGDCPTGISLRMGSRWT
jgi:hypothetical protein